MIKFHQLSSMHDCFASMLMFHDSWSESMILDQRWIDDVWWINDGWFCVNWSSWDSMIIDTWYIICISWLMVVDGRWLLMIVDASGIQFHRAATSRRNHRSPPKSTIPMLVSAESMVAPCCWGVPRMQLQSKKQQELTENGWEQINILI